MKRIKCLSMVVLVMLVCVSYGNAQTKMTQKVKPKAELKERASQVTMQGKLTTKASGKKESDLTAEQKAKKNLANRPAPKASATPSKVVSLKNHTISEAKRNEMRAKLKAKRQKRNFNFDSKGKMKKKN